MAKVKNELRGYQVIPRKLIFDASLSDRARFVYVFMSAKPEDWEFFLEPMAKEIGYSVDTLRKYIRELVEAGWIEKGGQSNSGGVFGATEYTLKAEPYRKNTDTENFRHGKIPTQHNRDCKDNIDIRDNREKKEDNKLSEKVSASEESIRYADIQQCWNETNGDRLGRVNAMTGKRKSWIKHILSEHNIDCQTLMLYIRTLPYADHWLYNPNADHKNWKPDFDWWMKNTSGWFTKLTEGKVHKENPEAFNAIINGTEMPFSDGGLFSQPTAESSSDAESSVVINGQTYR